MQETQEMQVQSLVQEDPVAKEMATHFSISAWNLGSVSGLGRSPGEGNSYPFQYSCLGNPMDRGAWRATVHRVTKDLT